MVKTRKFSLAMAVVLAVIMLMPLLLSAKASASTISDAYEGVKTLNGIYKVALLDADFHDTLNGCLTQPQESKLLDLMEQTAEKIQCNIGIAITSDLHGMSHITYTENFNATMFGAYSDSVSLLLLNRHDNPAYAAYKDYLLFVDRADDLYGSKSEKIFDRLYAPLGKNEDDFYGACAAFCSALTQYKSGSGSISSVFHIDLTVVFFALVGGVIMSVIIVSSCQRGYKKKTPISASHYIDKGRTRINRQTDQFVREHTTSVHLSSSSSGGSHHSGGGHSHSSGGHHSSGHSGRGR